ncbi:MAG TPA: hypothetical protein VGK84_00585, partial [Candidatus Tumulicola sp.]
DEMLARYYLGVGLLLFKRRSIDAAFETLRKAIAGARRYDDAALLGAMLTNYATASVQDGSVTDALTCLEAFEGLQSSAPRKCRAVVLSASEGSPHRRRRLRRTDRRRARPARVLATLPSRLGAVDTAEPVGVGSVL